MRLKILFAIAMVPFAGLLAQPAYASVGSIPGSYKVDSQGNFGYTIPIPLPRGPNGVTPHLSVVYDSASETPEYDRAKGTLLQAAGTNNPDAISAGAGWVLTGLSMIDRTPATYADDGVSSRYQYQPGDRYALDGNRLRLTSSGNYGQDGSTYETEIADAEFSQATAHGDTGNGPAYWTVQGKDGLTYEYGNTTDSKVLDPSGASGEIREWLLDKVSDAYGNSYTVTYGPGVSGSSGVAVPMKISWTPASQGSSTYNYTVSFTYSDPVAQDTSAGFTLAGGAVENNSLLSSITIAYQGTTVHYYQLTYSPSTVTGRSLLASVEECSDSSMSNCLTPTGFAYNGGLPGTAGSGQTAVSGATHIVGAYDFLGNGRSDILYLQGSTLYVALSNGSGFDPGVSTGITPDYWLIGNVLNDGKDDILTMGSGGVWWLYSWNGSGFTGTALGIPVCQTCEYELADVNGDGLPDIIQLQVANDAMTISVALNTSSNGTASFGAMTPWGANVQIPQYTTGQVLSAWFITPQTYFQSFDRIHLEGVQHNEVMLGWLTPESYDGVTNDATVVEELVPSGDSFTGKQIVYYTSSSNAPAPQFFYGNFNSDRCTDFAWGGTAPSAIFYSICNGQGEEAVSNPGTVVGTADWDGDGLTDLLLDDGGTLGIETATATGFSPMVTTNIPLQSGDTVLPLTVTGSGLQDIGVISGGSLTYYLHNSVSSTEDAPPDAMTALTDGNGNTIKISYSSTESVNGGGSGIYTAGTEASSEDSPFTGNLFVVQSLTLPNGIGGSYTKTYQYTDARTGARGFEGFSQIKITDSRNGDYRETSYDLLFPETGMVSEDDLFQSDGNPISKTTYTNTDNELASAQYEDRHFPYASNVKTDNYEVGGADDGGKIAEKSTDYTPDSYGNFTSIDTTLTDEDANSPYDGDSWTSNISASYADDKSTWCLSLPASVAVSKSAPGQATITHTSTYSRDGSFCRPASVLEDAGNSAFDITRSYQYDGFGNVSQVTVTGSGIDRVWTYGYGQTGQFEETVRNPVAYANSYEEKIGYDYALGLKTSDVIQSLSGAQNAPPTQWSYDWLGRLTEETFPDGTTLNWAYSACSSTCYGGIETVAETANATQSSGGAEITDQSRYLDSFGRTVATTKRLMDGSYSLIERQYDDLGNIIDQSAPCKGCSSPEYWTKITYDGANRPTRIVSPAPWTSAGEGTTLIAYTGLETTTTNADGEVTQRFVDATGELRRLIDATGYEVDFTPDSDGNVRTVSDSAGTITANTYDYGGEGDYLATRGDRALGSTWTYNRDALGDALSYGDANGRTFETWYDGLGRPVEREDWVGDPSSTPGDPGVTCAGNGTANSCETDTLWTWGTTPASHDIGHIAEAQTTTAAGTYVEEDSYDSDGRLQYPQHHHPGRCHLPVRVWLRCGHRASCASSVPGRRH